MISSSSTNNVLLTAPLNESPALLDEQTIAILYFLMNHKPYLQISKCFIKFDPFVFCIRTIFYLRNSYTIFRISYRIPIQYNFFFFSFVASYNKA